MSSAGELAIDVKSGKTSNRRQVQEKKKKLVSSAGKLANGDTHRNTSNRYQARENEQPVASVGKEAMHVHITGKRA